MRPFLRSRSQQVAAVVAGGIVLAVGFLPLFGGPGYEHALASGLVLPTAAAIATALDVARADEDTPWLAFVARGVASGLALAAIGFATAIAHGLRIAAMDGSLAAGFCDLGGGARGYALTAGVGAVMGGAWGAIAGLVARRTKRVRLACALLGIAAPLGGALVSVARFYTSPIVFAFDPFVGYFSGTLYDTVIDAGMALVTYRVGSLCSLGAVAFGAAAVDRRSLRSSASHSRRLSSQNPPLGVLASQNPPLGVLSSQNPPPGPLPARREGEESEVHATPSRHPLPARREGAGGWVALALACLAASLFITLEGPSLGHWQTSSTIAAALRGFRAGPRCDVVYPDGLREDQVRLLVRDCEEELARDEQFLGTHLDGRLTAFFFRDAGEKKHFMGAGDTYIAKPWRREVYLQMHAYPHPVLGHEIAHVVAGSMARGPFRVAGALGGWWPDPGLIEGTAVATSPDDGELTDAQWARAMNELHMVPPMRDVFSLGFLGQSAAKSYTLAGAFVLWVHDRYGAEALRAWYGGASLAEVVRVPWEELDAQWRASLASVPLPEEALAYARARFGRPSVFGRTCPHVVDALEREANGCRDGLQIDRARALYGDVLVRDAHDWGAQWGLGIVELRYGDARAGAKAMEALAADEVAPRPWRDRAKESLADADLMAIDPARWERAARAYEELAATVGDEDLGRTLDVKGYGAAKGGEARSALAALLVGTEGRPPDVTEGLARVAAWEARSGDGVAAYVLGKNLVNQEFWAEASDALDRALARADTLTARVQRELVRQRAITACALGDAATADAMAARAADPGGPFAKSVGRRAAVEALVARCRAAN